MAEEKKQKFFDKLKLELISFLIFVIYHILIWTWKIEEDPMPEEIQKLKANNGTLVLAHFHEDEWALFSLYKDRNLSSMVSLSNDGQLMSRFLERSGAKVHRGSSSRGGARGFLSIIKAIRKDPGANLSFAVDGPRGPRRRAKNGVFKSAELLKAPILPLSAHADKAWVFKKAWNKAFIPKPFARVKITYADPILTPELEKYLGRDDYAVLAEMLENKLLAAKRLAQKILQENT